MSTDANGNEHQHAGPGGGRFRARPHAEAEVTLPARSTPERLADEMIDASLADAALLDVRIRDARITVAAARRQSLLNTGLTGADDDDAHRWEETAARAEEDLADLLELREHTILGLAASQNRADNHARLAAAAELSPDPQVAATADYHRGQVLDARLRLEAAADDGNLTPVPGGALMPGSMLPAWGDIAMVAAPVIGPDTDRPDAYRVSFIRADKEVERITLDPWQCTTLSGALDKAVIAYEVDAMARRGNVRIPHIYRS
jgi:hypothetical protein